MNSIKIQENIKDCISAKKQILKFKKKRVLKKVGDEKAGIRWTGGKPYQIVSYDKNEMAVCSILDDKHLGRQWSQYNHNSGK